MDRAVPGLDDPDVFRGFVGAYCSSIVHDVNAVHGLLDALGIADGEIVGAAALRRRRRRPGRGPAARRPGAVEHGASGRAERFADYRERITLYFDDAALELEFPSP